ncbi:transporter [Sphaerisporangium siamense]|uniref:Phosphoglycerol transferase MdoB-like AlkP superfamily enzyme n=1 Tax=Sphaerisporangium siamense TaxID=795645 RepID=A0A7W7D2N4_9ACTN|nr:AmiS/UreI family transporter [Sphaerisporangium siamense]MBB4698884.1 phosphoglycerol transferase MdoB-like AlkP superfamily enzyme [Sphaerisporangium siamense]GII89069.1 transporter [Sphaerisporangium siamense]
MSDVGLLFVGAVLIINGVMLLGTITDKAAAPLNFFVGVLQVVTPTFLIMTADGDRAIIAGAAGLYLFGFTYLWVGINAATGWPGEGLGWFSLFVAAAAVGYAIYTWQTGGRVFTVIWLAWALLWFLFFLLLALGRTRLSRFTGLVAIAEGVLTAAVPAALALTGLWRDSTGAALIAAVLAVVALAVLWWAGRVPGRPASAA